MNAQNTGAIAASIVIGLILLGVGIIVGIFYQAQQQAQQIAPQNGVVASSPIIKELTSKVIASINAYGQVTSINGNNITLNPVGDTSANDGLTISMNNNAKIYSIFVPTGATNSKTQVTPKEASFSDIKIGDYLNTNVIIDASSGNKLEGQSAYIYIYSSSQTNSGSK